MRLSEAIRLGAMWGPQAFGQFRDGDATCAWGSAHAAVGVKQHAYIAVPEWSALDKTAGRLKCPCSCGTRPLTLKSMMVHLNDDHRWTREQIADWVEGIELAQTPPAESREEASNERHSVAPAVSAAK